MREGWLKVGILIYACLRSSRSTRTPVSEKKIWDIATTSDSSHAALLRCRREAYKRMVRQLGFI